MADTYLSSVKIGVTEYDIYAKSALSAGWVPASAIDGPIPVSSITAVVESAISSVNVTAVTGVTADAISGDIPWSSISSNAQPSSTSSTSGFWTPSSTIDYVTYTINDKISNVYKYKGSCEVAKLPTNAENGDVWDIKDGGDINAGTTEYADTVMKGDNVAWVKDETTPANSHWDKLANSLDINGKLDTSVFEAWSANTNNNSQFLGSAASANTAWVAVNVSGTSTTVNGQDLIDSAASGYAASAWIKEYETTGKPVWVTQSYLSGDGTSDSPIGLRPTESNIVTGNTDASALVNAQGISSYVDSNYIAKNDIKVETHQLVIDNT